MANPHRDSFAGTREINGMSIKFEAVGLRGQGLYEIRVTDHFGEVTKDTVDGCTVWDWIGAMVDDAEKASRERAKEIVGVES